MPPRTHKDKITHHVKRVKTAAQKARDLHRKQAAEALRAQRAAAQEQSQA
jgi:hypothetical protein